MKTVDFGICGAHKILLLFWEGRGGEHKGFLRREGEANCFFYDHGTKRARDLFRVLLL